MRRQIPGRLGNLEMGDPIPIISNDLTRCSSMSTIGSSVTTSRPYRAVTRSRLPRPAPLSHPVRTVTVMVPGVETGLELTLGLWRGCVMCEDRPFTVETVAEARSAILRFAMEALDHHAHDPQRRQYLRLNVGADGPAWPDLIECEQGRRYNPGKPDDGMKCSYLLYRQDSIEGVGGLRWTYSVTIWATAPPKVWNHPADQPTGHLAALATPQQQESVA